MVHRTCVAFCIFGLALGCQDQRESRPIGHQASVARAPNAETPSGGAAIDAAAGAGEGGAERDGGARNACPTSAPGPGMVEFESPGGLRYCMDRTEVTQGQYAEFLAANVDASSQTHPLCPAEKNPDFEPRVVEPFCNIAGGGDYGLCVKGFFQPETRGDLPMTCVDFCDASAYCAWSGKRLCGAPGKPGRTFGDGFDPTSEFSQALAPEMSHWHNACSAGGMTARAFPAGFDVSRCSGPKSVGTRPECAIQGRNAAVYDLVGGVSEWQDLCTDDGHCRVLGGMSGLGPERGSCDQDATTSVGAADRSTGFRCCLDLGPPT